MATHTRKNRATAFKVETLSYDKNYFSNLHRYDLAHAIAHNVSARESHDYIDRSMLRDSLEKYQDACTHVLLGWTEHEQAKRSGASVLPRYGVTPEELEAIESEAMLVAMEIKQG